MNDGKEDSMATSNIVEVSPSPPISNICPESSFFTECRASALPSPAAVRALNQLSGNYRATFFNRPSPVIVPSLGLFVKYGAGVTAAEAESQRQIREWVQGQVPIPEVFGWTEDEGQVFIYMQLVQGETLQARFNGLDEGERQSICAELGSMVKAWRSLKQEEPKYIGTLGQQPLNDIFIAGHPELAGPFVNPGAVERFQSACGIEIDNQIPITFTHNDLCPPNIDITWLKSKSRFNS
ncbi:phosphotransferase family [Fusarium albosuccineum]|uniref:Phosphotransferase family n=1 Tax=Fusarium albosuccineum TaxID=1237068 RepID=A0A8H4NY77_9HYPO|nr:phosphotransferase family [Fusarium albosuccineum]